ncbi:tetratricopeptide repeat protein, partial [uncultured Microscilla sp.]|uniref:tetratricopeptide repeat protein n=1 Tax=uncultured Microscilla sp. TaxID=432653 RepID=UPI0026132CFB
MNKTALLDIIENPAKISKNTLNELEDIAERFPYFQAVHVLLAKGAHEKDAVLAPGKIRRAAIYAYNRNLLRELLNHDYGNTPEITLDTDTSESDTASFFDTINNEYEPTHQTSRLSDNALVIDPSEELDEDNAFDLYREGKVDEAKNYFHKLIVRYPDKREYYQNQANILMDGDYQFDEALLDQKVDNNTENEGLTTTEEFNKVEEETPVKAERTEELNNEVDLSDRVVIDLAEEWDESVAFELYNNGKVDEAKVYFDKLIIIYPDKKEYYTAQANILMDGNYQFDESLADKVYLKPAETIEDSQNETVDELAQEKAILPEDVPVPSATDLGHPEYVDTFDLLRDVEPEVKAQLKVSEDELTEDLAIEYFANGERDLAAEVYQKLMQKYPTRKEYFQTQFELLTEHPELFGIGVESDEIATNESSHNDQKNEENKQVEVSKPTHNGKEISRLSEHTIEVNLPDGYILFNPLLLSDPFEWVRDENLTIDAFDIVRGSLEFDITPQIKHQDVQEPLPLVAPLEADAEDEEEEQVLHEEDAVSGIPNENDITVEEGVDLFDDLRDWESAALAGAPHTEGDDYDLDLFELVRHWEAEQIAGKVVHDEQVEDGFDAFEAVRGWESEQIEGKVVHD